jgi:hypothetical protein
MHPCRTRTFRDTALRQVVALAHCLRGGGRIGFQPVDDRFRHALLDARECLLRVTQQLVQTEDPQGYGLLLLIGVLRCYTPWYWPPDCLRQIRVSLV